MWTGSYLGKDDIVRFGDALQPRVRRRPNGRLNITLASVEGWPKPDTRPVPGQEHRVRRAEQARTRLVFQPPAQGGKEIQRISLDLSRVRSHDRASNAFRAALTAPAPHPARRSE